MQVYKKTVNSWPSCTPFFIQEGIYDELIKGLNSKAGCLRVSDLINNRYERLHRIIDYWYLYFDYENWSIQCKHQTLSISGLNWLVLLCLFLSCSFNTCWTKSSLSSQSLSQIIHFFNLCWLNFFNDNLGDSVMDSSLR